MKLFQPLTFLALNLSYCPFLLAEQVAAKTPEVGKHVASNNLDLASLLLSLIVVLGLIIVAAALLKKFQIGTRTSKELNVITSLHLGPKERLVVVEVNKKQLLLGVTAHNISILQELETPLKPAQVIPSELSSGFINLLKKQ
ncbi:flagellar biosynthetic protein FliO [Colwellia sp. MEBiC06753]